MNLDSKTIKSIISDAKVRRELTKQSHEYFFPVYFGDYIKYPSAKFHEEMFRITEDESIPLSVVTAFRGSAKSTIFSLSYPIWAILGKQQKKFVLILSQTQLQAKQILKNIKTELETNELLKQDLGPFEEPDDEWHSQSLVIPKYNARISVASAEQSIRGIKHLSYRPDLIICDDIEDLASAKTKEGRHKTFSWLTGEVIPAGDKNTKMVIVGNLVHEDSVMMRLRKKIKDGEVEGVFRAYPIMRKDGASLWPGKFPDQASLDREKQKVMSPQAWEREFMLRIIPDDGQVIHKEWIHYYDELYPKNIRAYRNTYSAVDLAISQKDSADNTAIVSARVYGRREKLRIYILPNPVNQKLTFPEQVELIKSHKKTVLSGSYDQLVIESVAYQEALPQVLEAQGIEATAVKPKGDKRSRLALTSTLLHEGRIKFPKEGCEELIKQLVGFGVERHDDLADAFSLLILHIMDEHMDESTFLMAWLDLEGGDDDIVRFGDYYDVETETCEKKGW